MNTRALLVPIFFFPTFAASAAPNRALPGTALELAATFASLLLLLIGSVYFWVKTARLVRTRRRRS